MESADYGTDEKQPRSGLNVDKWVSPQTPTYSVICPQAGQAFTLCLKLQRVNRESRRCACSPKNYHSTPLEAMNSVRKITIIAKSKF